MSTNIQGRKITLFILKEDRELYAFSDDKKIVNEFISTREMDNFIIKEKRMDYEEYDAFVHYNNGKILNTDYLYDGTNTFEFPMTTDESFKLEVEIDELYKKVGDNDIVKFMKVFKGKYKKSLKNMLLHPGKRGVCILLRAPMLERTIDYCHDEALRHHAGYKSRHNGVPHSIHKTGFRGF